ncbi:MAG: hypothetical protein IS632_07525 [Thaumarchaeota archaeon]|nr:hypothetical protein [Nitrososphaerota archaeon]
MADKDTRDGWERELREAMLDYQRLADEMEADDRAAAEYADMAEEKRNMAKMKGAVVASLEEEIAGLEMKLAEK